MLEVNVKIEGFDEEGNAEPDIQAEIIHKVSQQIASKIEYTVRQAVEQHFRASLAANLDKNIEAFLAKPFQPTNSYGEKRGEPVTLIEHICKAGVEYLSQQVSMNGGQVGYNDKGQMRVTWFAGKMAEEALGKELTPILEKAKSDAKEFITNKVAVALKQAMATAIK